MDDQVWTDERIAAALERCDPPCDSIDELVVGLAHELRRMRAERDALRAAAEQCGAERRALRRLLAEGVHLQDATPARSVEKFYRWSLRVQEALRG